jgi:hypothetical protein
MKKQIFSFIAGCAVLAATAYADPTPAELQAEIESLKATVKTLQNALNADIAKGITTLASLQNQINLVASNPALQLGPFVSVDPNPENFVKGPNIVFRGANIHIESGSGATDDHAGTYGTATTGLGNLIIGYDEVAFTTPNSYTRTGSNNLIVGDYHQFSSYGGVIFGTSNTLSGGYAVVLGGGSNRAYGFGSAIVAGVNNITGTNPLGTGNGDYCVILGGNQNFAKGTVNVLVGGVQNETDSGGYESVILGGYNNYIGDNGTNSIGNYTQGQQSVITGGYYTHQYGNFSVLLGGNETSNSTDYSVIPVPTAPN